jgi:hypothetical protein
VGSTNTGGGGGGGGDSNNTGGTGGSGVVVLRYPTAYTLASGTGTYTYLEANGYHIYKFTQSGTITF